MFDNTRGAVNKVLDDLKRLIFAISLLVQILIIGNLVIHLVQNSGVFVANVILLVANAIYFVFYIYQNGKKIEKSTKKTVKKIHKGVKYIGKLVNVVSVGYDIVFAVKAFDPLTFLVMVFTAIGLLIEGLLHILLEWIIKPKIEFIKEGFKTDVQPVVKALDFVNKLKGKDTSKEIPEKTQKELAAAKATQLEKDEIRKAEKRAENKRTRQTVFSNLKAMIFKKKP